MRVWFERLLAAAACAAAAPASAADVQALLGKTVIAAWSESDREMDVASGREEGYAVKVEARFSFGADGRIATRYDRAINDRAPFSATQTFDANGALLTGPASGVYKIVKIDFDEGGLAATLIWGSHGAQQIKIAVAPGAASCSGDFLQGADKTGSTEYVSPVDGKRKRSVSRQVSGFRCRVADGDAVKG